MDCQNESGITFLKHVMSKFMKKAAYVENARMSSGCHDAADICI